MAGLLAALLAFAGHTGEAWGQLGTGERRSPDPALADRPDTKADPATASAAGDGGAADAGVPGLQLRTVSGRIAGIDRAALKLTIRPGTEAGAEDAADVTLDLDRNTAVFLADRLGTIGDLRAGAPVRASYGQERRAFWVEVGSPSGPPEG